MSRLFGSRRLLFILGALGVFPELASAQVPTLQISAAQPAAPCNGFPASACVTYSGGAYTPSNALTFQVTSSGAPVGFTASAFGLSPTGATWLTVTTPVPQTTPDSVSVMIDASQLPSGTYLAYLILTSSSAGNSPLNIPIVLTVPTAAFQVNSQTVSFGNINAPITNTSIEVTDSGAQPIAFTMATSTVDNGNWLTVTAGNSSTTPSQLSISVDPTGLAPASYVGYVILSPNDESGGALVAVTFTVGFPTLQVSSPQPAAPCTSFPASACVIVNGLTYSPANQLTFQVGSSGGLIAFGALANATSPPPFNMWLSVAGTTLNSVTVQIDASQLTLGTYLGYLILTSPNASNSPLFVPIGVTVYPIAAFQVSSQTVSFGTIAGPQTNTSVNVTDAGPNQLLPFSLSSSTVDGAQWLSATASNNSTTPSQLSVNVDPTGLAAGNYLGYVTLSPNDGSSGAIVAITFTTAGPPLMVQTTSLPDGNLNVFYSFGLTATGGVPPYSNWTVTTGSLPLGLSLDPSTGLISGTPFGSGGFYGFSVTVSDNAGNTSPPQPLSITILGGGFQANPSLVSFGTITGPQMNTTVQVTDPGFAVGFDLMTITTDGNNWLSVMASNGGVTPSQLSISVDPTGLPVANYTGYVILSPVDGSAGATVVVTFSTTPTGTIQVNATLNGAAWSGAVNYQLSGPSSQNGTSVPASYANEGAGSYTLSNVSGGPAGATLANITPSATQTLSSGATITFTLNFTAPTTGAIQVNATLNGITWSGAVSYQLSGPSGQNGTSVPASYSNEGAGSYTLSNVSAGPAGATLVNITPSATQSLSSGGTITFTLNFTAPTTGTIQVNATLNGSTWSGAVSYQLSGPSGQSGTSVPASYTNEAAGSYTLSNVSGLPAGATLANITPSATQTLSDGGTITFTLNFTAPTTGTIQVNATLNGSPWSGAVSYHVTGPTGQTGTSVPASYTGENAGSYVLAYSSGGPAGATLANITPSATQTLSNGTTITFTLNFTSPASGTIQVKATLNGSPWSGTVSYQLSGPSGQNGTSVPASYASQSAGSYTLANVSGGPPGGTLANITPSATQSLSSGTTITFTLNFTVACVYTVSPSSVYLDSESQSAPPEYVTAGPSCAWSASSTGGFMTITSGATGSGNGVVTFAVGANSTKTDLSGTLTVAGHSVPVTQRETPTTFTDVTPPDYYFDFTNVLYESGITGGCATSPLQYCPNENITRGEMAVFIVVAAEGGSTFNYNPVPYFTDVLATNPYFKFIQKLKELGITSGCSATMYCPDDSVTRAEMAVFIIVARYESTPYSYPATLYFTDVPATNPFFPFVQKMAQVGITAGCAPNLYCPNETLTRGQMAVFIVTGLLNELLGPTAPVVTAAIPSQAAPGQSITVTLTGVHTHFAGGTTQVATAPYITATNVEVSSETTLTVQLAVSGSAVSGPTSIVVTTGSEEAVLPNGFTVQ